MNHKEIIHYFLKERIRPTDRVLDMTCGNGYDTFFLANLAKEVYAIDIQKEAIHITKIRCQEFDNVKYFNMDHSTIDFNETIDGALYNLGYLPSANKSIITQSESTLESLDRLLKKDLKYLSIATYPGHPGGMEEHLAVRGRLDDLGLDYIELQYSSPKSPVSFLVDFVKPSSAIIHVDELKHLPQKQAWIKLQSILQGS